VRPAIFYAIALLILISDQITKWAVLSAIPYGTERSILGGFLFLNPTRNTGGAFSVFEGRNTLFIWVALVAIGVLVYAFHRHQRSDLAVSAALALALGGAVGNLIDRVRFAYVIDFFDIRVRGENVWPIFNIADSAITIGIVVLAWQIIFKRERKPETHLNGHVPCPEDQE
jgi:signal peptidase II